MSINRKLKLAILCAALSGVTVACTKDKDNNQTLALAPQGQQEQPKEESNEFKAPAKTAGDTLADQLMVLSNQKQDCSKTAEIMKEAWVQKILVDGNNTVVSTREGTRFLVEKIEAESDPFCQIDVIAEVSKTMYNVHLKSSDYPKTAEQKELGMSIVETYLAGIQPILKKVRALVQIKKGEVFDAAQIIDQNLEVGDKEGQLNTLVRELDEIADCSAYNCNQKTSNAARVATSAKATLASIEAQLKKVEEFKTAPGNVGFSAIRGGMVNDIIATLDVEIEKAKAVISAE